jgi:hypothetical protein
MKFKSYSFVLAGATSLSLLFGCKARDESGSSTKDNSNQVVTETGTAGQWMQVVGTGKQQNYAEIQVATAGLLTLDISMSAADQAGFKNPVKVAVYDQPNQVTPIASGDVTPGQWPTWMSGAGAIEVKQPGSIFVLISHGGEMENGDISTQVLGGGQNPARVINYPGNYQSVEPVVNDAISLQIAGSQSLAQINVNLTIHAASDKIENVNNGGGGQNNAACPTCKAFLVLTDNGKDYSVPLTFQDKNVSGTATFKLQAKTYDLKIKFEGVKSGSIVQTYIDANQFTNNNGQPFVAGNPMGMLDLTFDQTNNKKAVHGGKAFGYFVTSDRATETKIDLNLEVNRIANLVKADAVVPKSIKAVLGGPGANYATKVADIDLANGWGSSFNGSLITDIGKGKYRILFDKAGLDKTDILSMGGSMYVSNLSIADGGPAASTFQDLGTVTVTPPNNYLVDLKVVNQPHTPVATPIDLASKSVLEGMEKVRLQFHVRIPKGATRGSTNTIDSGTIEACLGNTAEHWSDMMIHYYCQYGQARSCYTNTIRGKAQGIQANTTMDTPTKIAALQKIRLETWTECEATAATDEEWKWLVDNQAQVFQYVMNSQTFAFSDEQQQAVINKFYRINDPSDKGECALKRPRRAIDPTDGTHCMSKKIYSPAMTSVGR